MNIAHAVASDRAAFSLPEVEGSVYNRLGLALMAAAAFAQDAEPLHRFFLAIAATPSLVTESTPSPALQLSASTFLGFAFLLLAALPRLGQWGYRAAFFAGLLLIIGPTIVKSVESPFYDVDSTSYTRYATKLFVEGQHPYRSFDVYKAEEIYPIQPTAVTYYLGGERVNSLNYPAGAFISLAPLYILGDIDPRWLYGLATLVIAGFVVLRAPPSVRVLALGVVVFHQFYYVWTVAGGIGEPLWMAFLVLAWATRDRLVLSSVLMGWAIATKQPAWFFFPFYLIDVYQREGLRSAVKSGSIASLVFAATNFPFILTDPRAWWEGVMAPMLASFPPLGVALAHWGTLAYPAVPKTFYTALEAVAMLAALASFWRWGRRSEALAFALPWIPLWFAWRCLSVYFYLMPLAILFAVFEQHRRERDPRTSWLLLPVAFALMSIVSLVLTGAYEAYLVWDELVNQSLSNAFRIRLAFLTLILSGFSLAVMTLAATSYGESVRLRLWSVFASVLMLVFLVMASLSSFPTYQVDNGLATHYAALELVNGDPNPYAPWEFHVVARMFNAPHPLMEAHIRNALFEDTLSRDTFGYPAGAFLTLAPFAAVHFPDMRILYGITQVALVLVVFVAAAATFKPTTLAVAVSAISLSFLFVGEGFNDMLLGLVLLAAWRWRKRPIIGGLLLGLAASVKQTAWFFIPFYVIAQWHTGGRRYALLSGLSALGVFLLTNAPFIIAAPDVWATGVFAFARSTSVVSLAIGAVLFVVAIAAYGRWGRQWPLAALVLPWVPLWFVWPALFSIFHVLPLLFMAASQLERATETEIVPSITDASPPLLTNRPVMSV